MKSFFNFLQSLFCCIRRQSNCNEDKQQQPRFNSTFRNLFSCSRKKSNCNAADLRETPPGQCVIINETRPEENKDSDSAGIIFDENPSEQSSKAPCMIKLLKDLEDLLCKNSEPDVNLFEKTDALCIKPGETAVEKRDSPCMIKLLKDLEDLIGKNSVADSVTESRISDQIKNRDLVLNKSLKFVIDVRMGKRLGKGKKGNLENLMRLSLMTDFYLVKVLRCRKLRASVLRLKRLRLRRLGN